MKGSQSILNPFGDDDEDIELNYIVDRNLQLSYIIVEDDPVAGEEAEEDPYTEHGGIPPAIQFCENYEAHKMPTDIILKASLVISINNANKLNQTNQPSTSPGFEC